ncbi:ABC-2 type transport system ATP-binding protein [Paenibacillus phyllosphaerae]|uniref:ABC-2 type transport system ATP-binding protein n=1 Tax=Paenibacillus phyllosphaerae TaxID=274593 RepID=A0A7W5AXW8_9BACL|nr:ABC transporter ATP-binding protein [Paenibacillus phyllosphaerae]MBB3110612.1 ABC-2 type transport system ATP-binding protein [Paenibacillus phyllosphaerae]
MSKWIVETNQLTKKLGGKAVVSDVNLRIKEGDIYGFLGPNGAGKTTTIRMLLGLAKPTYGHVHIFGHELARKRIEILRKVGSLVEYPSFYGHLTAYDNLEAVRRLLDVPRSRIDQVLEVVRLTKEARRAVKGYSLGMKQRLGIATALLGQPQLLVLDEPTNGLDPAGILEIRELIKRMPQEHGVTILVSSHLLSEIDQMANRVGIITKGKMIFQDETQVLRQQARSRIQLAVSEPEEAWRMLLAHGYHVDWDRQQLTAELTDDKAVATMVAALVQHEFAVYRVQEESASLEQIFLNMTGGEGSL